MTNVMFSKLENEKRRKMECNFFLKFKLNKAVTHKGKLQKPPDYKIHLIDVRWSSRYEHNVEITLLLHMARVSNIYYMQMMVFYIISAFFLEFLLFLPQNI
uniref:Uncharacterized protein n=1 Tax=Ascaris lumbricoides TaxID=6252 RepID=A0A0M3HRQ6_ASCLU